MPTVVFRSESPYVPRAIHPRAAPMLALVPDYEPTLRIAVLADGPASEINELTTALTALGHHVEIISLQLRSGRPFLPGFVSAAIARVLSLRIAQSALDRLKQRSGSFDLIIDAGSAEPGTRPLESIGLPVVSLQDAALSGVRGDRAAQLIGKRYLELVRG